MQSNTLVWIAVACIGIGNLYIGRLLAIWGLPQIVVGKRSWRTFFLFFTIWIIGMILLYQLNNFKLTFTQAYILSIFVLSSFCFCRSYYGTGVPPVPWDEYLNKQLRSVVRICERHTWDTSSREEFQSLASLNQINFDGGDYDILIQMQSDLVFELNKNLDFLTPRLPDGSIEYDRACAQRIVAMFSSLAGSKNFEGILSLVSQDYDMSGFDSHAYTRLRWLSEAIYKQWGENKLWTSESPNKVV